MPPPLTPSLGVYCNFPGVKVPLPILSLFQLWPPPFHTFCDFPDIIKVKPVMVSCFEIPGQPFSFYNLVSRCFITSLATKMSLSRLQLHRPPSHGRHLRSDHRQQLLHPSREQQCQKLQGKLISDIIRRSHPTIEVDQYFFLFTGKMLNQFYF